MTTGECAAPQCAGNFIRVKLYGVTASRVAIDYISVTVVRLPRTVAYNGTYAIPACSRGRGTHAACKLRVGVAVSSNFMDRVNKVSLALL